MNKSVGAARKKDRLRTKHGVEEKYISLGNVLRELDATGVNICHTQRTTHVGYSR